MCFTAIGSGQDDKIRLTDVSSITFHRGEKTKSRHTRHVPQLMCIGGSAGCTAFSPSAIKCFNKGFDGYDVRVNCDRKSICSHKNYFKEKLSFLHVCFKNCDTFLQWKCKTTMDSQYRLGEIKVSCEGYDYPDDPHILKGSCRVCTQVLYCFDEGLTLAN